MNKVAVVLGVAAVATLAGCKDPDYVKGNTQGSQNEVKQVPVQVTQDVKPAVVEPMPPPEPVKRTCKCPPGTKHAQPCQCGADDCLCIVEVKPVRPVEPETTVYIVQSGDYLAKISKKYNVTISSIKRLNGLKNDRLRIGQKLKLPGKFDVVQTPAKSVAPVPVAAKATKKVSVPYAGETKEYVVKNGDTIGGIAYSNDINIRQLKELNGLTSDVVRVGQKLKVPAVRTTAPVKVSAPVKTAAPVKPAVAKKTSTKPSAATDRKFDESKKDIAPVEAKDTATAPAETAPVVSTTAPAEAAQTPAEATPSEDAKPVETVAAPATKTYVVKEGEDIQGVAISWGITTAEIRELNNLGENDALKAGQVLKLPADAQQ